jgi:hypothetical protein
VIELGGEAGMAESVLSEARKRAEATLPADAIETFDALVRDYQTAAENHVPGQQRWVNYNILVDLVRNGWRKTAKLD